MWSIEHCIYAANDYLHQAEIERELRMDTTKPPRHEGNWRTVGYGRSRIIASLRLGPARKNDDRVWPPSNVWLGASVEDQPRADERIPELLRVPAAVRFLSIEPMLGPVKLDDPIVTNHIQIGEQWSRYDWAFPLTGRGWDAQGDEIGRRPEFVSVDWVIVGGESGPKARPCHVEWIRSIVEQCKAAGVPCFVKQLGARPVLDGKPLDLQDSKGGEPEKWPEDLRVREMPEVQR
jgi:hypothetical protein